LAVSRLPYIFLSRFNDAAPTAIYTLSLHDALPICVRSIWLRNDLANFKQRLRALEKHVAETGAVLTEAQVVALEKKRDDDMACGDRKSTRLNSSHVKISYAVFCLKKKRNNRSETHL